MPKLKTNKSAKKRVRVTGTGRLKRAHARISHNLEHRSRKAKRRLHKATYVSSADAKRVRRLLPYG